MSLKDQITSDMRDAMRAHDKEKLSALRMLLSSIKQKEVDEQITADNAVIQQIIAKLIKAAQETQLNNIWPGIVKIWLIKSQRKLRRSKSICPPSFLMKKFRKSLMRL